MTPPLSLQQALGELLGDARLCAERLPGTDIDLWLKEIAPSTELRRWFHQDAAAEEELFDAFQARYEAELETNPAVETLRGIVREHPVVTLLVGARDPELNHGKVLEEFLEHHP